MHRFPARTFVERAGPTAAAELASLARRCRAEGAPATLLRSRDQDDLHLLVVEGDPDLGPNDRSGARVWRFAEIPEPGHDAR